MCGIAGAIERNVRCASTLENTARAMIAPLIHRGPDAGGVWTDSGVGVALGHRRLSVIDLSPSGAQPMVSNSGNFVLSYNGEIYNSEELRTDLEKLGSTFRGYCDTEVLLEACAVWGVESTASRLIGMFAFALWDRTERCFWLVRDRLGIKPLYYSATMQRFTFASELTGITAHPYFDKTIDCDSVDAFLSLDYIPAPHSIFRDAQKLEPGSILRVDAQQPELVHIKPYWTLSKAAQYGLANRFTGTFEDATSELEQLLADAVTRRMVSDVPLGAFLSGGIDSSTVVALMQNQSSRPVKTFTIGFSSGAFDEAPFAKAVAEHLRTNHTEHYVTSEEIGEFGPDIMGHHDEPFADPSVLQSWILCRLARRDVTVVLTGDGGDELFGGYDRHITAERLLNHPVLRIRNCFTKTLIHRVIPTLPRSLRNFAARLPSLNDNLSPVLSHSQMRILATGVFAPELMHHCLAVGNIRVSSGKPIGSTLLIDLIDRWLKETVGLSASERQQYIDACGYLPDYVLARYDRMSMAGSLELRVPILDHRIVEFGYCLPSEYKVYGSITKKVLRSVLKKHVPEKLFERKKRGFGAPMTEWIYGPLREWVEDLMRSETLRRSDFLEPISTTRVLQRLNSGKFNRGDFRVVALAAWCDRNL